MTTAFSWRFVTPMFLGATLNPVNSSLIATALVPIAAGVDVPVGRTAVLISALYLAGAIAFPTAGNQTTLYAQADAELIGTASGLFRSFGWLGSIVSSALIDVVFRTDVTDGGLHRIAWIMAGVSVLGVLLLATDRRLLHRRVPVHD